MYVDLVGTCYDVLNKPMPITQRHVDIYRHKVIMGVHRKLRRDRDGEVNFDRDGVMDSALDSMDFEMNQEVPIDDPSQVVLHKEMFLDNTSHDRDI
jgi:hypothetical protein